MEGALAVGSIIPGSITAGGKSFLDEISEAVESFKEKRQAKADDKIFNTVRSSLLMEAFGITPENFEQFKADYLAALEKLEKINENASSVAKNMIDTAEEKKKVATAALQTDNAHIRDLREGWISFATGAVSTIGLSAALAAIVGGISPVIPIAGALIAKFITTLIKNHRIKKRMLNDKSDTSAKFKDYDKYLQEIMPKVIKFCEIIEAKKQDIIIQYKNIFNDKSIPKKQRIENYQQFIKNMVNQTLAEAGIEVQQITENDLNIENIGNIPSAEGVDKSDESEEEKPKKEDEAKEKDKEEDKARAKKEAEQKEAEEQAKKKAEEQAQKEAEEKAEAAGQENNGEREM